MLEEPQLNPSHEKSHLLANYYQMSHVAKLLESAILHNLSLSLNYMKHKGLKFVHYTLDPVP